MLKMLMAVLMGASLAACSSVGSTILPGDSTSLNAGPSESPSPAAIQAKVGTKVKIGEEQVHTVAKVEGWKGSQYLKPAAGNSYVAVLVRIDALAQTTYNPFWYKVRGPDGFEYTPTVLGREPVLSSSNTLQPGRSVQGWVTFEVPRVAAGKLTLIYTPGFFTQEIEVRLY